MTRDISVLRLAPVPHADPPYDDEVGPAARERTLAGPSEGPSGSLQGSLALSFPLPSGLPASPHSSTSLRLVPRPTESGRADGSGPIPGVVVPPVYPWACRFVQALVEVLAGGRPVPQLLRWTSLEVYEDVTGRVVASRAAPAKSRLGRPVVRSVHVSEPHEGVAEVCALVQSGRRGRALALRLERADGRWRCTELEVG